MEHIREAEEEGLWEMNWKTNIILLKYNCFKRQLIKLRIFNRNHVMNRDAESIDALKLISMNVNGIKNILYLKFFIEFFYGFFELCYNNKIALNRIQIKK